jgi:hypothetical protein
MWSYSLDQPVSTREPTRRAVIKATKALANNYQDFAGTSEDPFRIAHHPRGTRQLEVMIRWMENCQTQTLRKDLKLFETGE